MTDEVPDGRPRVLLVEDERMLAEIYASWLSDRYDVETAYDGEAALDAYDGTVDVVLLDRRMPGTSGDQVLERIREGTGECRVAMVSAVTPDFDVYDMGFDAYLVKPVTESELRDLVDRLIRVGDYDAGLQRHFALSSKLALLQGHKSRDELEASEEYATLRAELADLDRELSDTVGDISAEEIGAVLRER
jgi:DNA-binding response OmpR family regulator